MTRAWHLVTRRFAGDGLGAFLARALAGSGAVHAAGLALAFLVGVQLARGLGVEAYGQYGIAMAAIAMAGIPGEFGLPRLVTREVAAASAHGDLPRLFGVIRWANRTALLFALAAALLLAFGAYLLAGPSRSPVAAAILIGALVVPLVALMKIRGAALQGLQFVVLAQVPFNLVRPLLLSVLLLALFVLLPDADAPAAMALNVVTAAAALVAAHFWLRSRLPRPRPADLAESGRDWLASAFPMALTDGIRVFQAQLIILLLGALMAADQVGLFRVAISSAIMAAAPLTLVGLVIAPTLASLHTEGDTRRLRMLTARSAQAMTAGVAALNLPLILFGPWLIALVFGEEYRPAYPALAVLCIGQLANAAFGPTASLLVMSRQERRVTRASAISLLAAAIAVLLLVPPFGLVGAAVASSLALLIWNLLTWIDARQRLGIDTSVIGLVRWPASKAVDE